MVPIKRLEYVSETGLVSLPVVPLRQPAIDRPLRLLFVGRVIRTKGVRDLVAAIGSIATTRVVADVVGDGFDLGHCRALAADLGVADRVNFHGRLPRAQIDEYYAAADVFVFPSFREPGGNVVFEAMAYGLPLIVCDSGGPGAATDSHCAVRLAATTPQQLSDDIASAIKELANDSDRRTRMGIAARQRVEQVGLWSTKVERVSTLYEEIIQPSGDYR